MTKFIYAGIGIVAGGLFGYFVMYKLIGCATGTCPLTKNPYISTIYGALLGLLIIFGIKK